MQTTRRISLTTARRLALAAQCLAGSGPHEDASPQDMLELARHLGFLQLDPTSAVARSHLLVLWSRLGRYDPAALDRLLWEERRLIEDWAHAASIVPTEDYPIFAALKRQWAATPGFQRMGVWMDENAELRDHILAELARRGPLPSRRFRDLAVKDWHSEGWNEGRNVDRMLAGLWQRGQVMVAGRAGGQKLWDLVARCLPEWAPREALSDEEYVRLAAQKSLRGLGVARASHIRQHYVRGAYPGLEAALAALEAEGRIVPVAVDGDGDVRLKPGAWYVHTEDVPLLDAIEGGDWEPHTTLLSPFDNLIGDRKRVEELFDFRFRLEIYTPAEKRAYGFFVLPILHGDRLIGRVDPLMNRKQKRLVIRAVHAEAGESLAGETGRAVRAAIEELAGFLGAREIVGGEKGRVGEWVSGRTDSSSIRSFA